MAARSNALLRYKTIDACLRDQSKKYTLKDLIIACSNALGQRVSSRTLQLDIQFMRNKKEGYAAPIVVYEHKYYKYKNPKYSLSESIVKKRDIAALQEIVATLKQYSSFNEFANLAGAINIIDEQIGSVVQKRDSVICCESKEKFGGVEYFDTIYDAILNKKVLCIGYHSSRSNNIISMIFYPMYLKEYRGRWFALGYKDGLSGVYRLPLDRIRDFSYAILPFPKELEFNPALYFKDIIGVTKLTPDARLITLLAKNKIARYLRLNPLHRSQQILKEYETGDIELTIEIVPNREFYTKIFELMPDIQILSPREIGTEANERVTLLLENLPYQEPIAPADPDSINPYSDDEYNLFSPQLN